MKALQTTAECVVPVFLVILAGMFLVYAKVVSGNDASIMNKLVFRVFLPISIAQSIYASDGTMPSGSFFLFLLFFFVAVFVFCRLIIPKVCRDTKQQGVIAQALCRSNYTLLGYALVLSLYPNGDNGMGSLMVAVSIPVHSVLSVLCFEMIEKKREKKGLLKKILLNPLMLGCFAGILLKVLPVRVPQLMDAAAQKLGNIASPLALFAVGASINPKRIVNNARILMGTVVIRLIFIPAVSLAIMYLIGFRGPVLAAFLCYVGAPTAVSSCPTAAEMGGDTELAAQIVAFTTLISGFTLFLFIFFFKSIGAL